MVRKQSQELAWKSDDYNPSISAQVKNAKNRWGSPEENRMNLIKWGIQHLDQALWGIDTLAGELNIILGAEKERKTTLAFNIIANIQEQTREEIKPYISHDTLESGMNSDKVTDSMISIMASRYLMKLGHVPQSHGRCPVCGGECKELRINPDSLRFMNRSPIQSEAIDYGINTIANWKVDIYEANPKKGSTRSLSLAIEKWRYLAEQGFNIFSVDHVQQYRFQQDTTDYEKQIRAVSEIGDFVSETNTVVFMLSQVSLWSLRDRGGDIGLTASGGKKGHQEANSVISTSYKDNSGFMKITLEQSRKSGSLAMFQKMDDESGAFFDRSFLPYEWEKEQQKLAYVDERNLVQAKAF